MQSLINIFFGFFFGIAVRCWDAVWLHFEKKLKARPERLRWVMRQLSRVPILKSKILTMDPAKRRRADIMKNANAIRNVVGEVNLNSKVLAPSVRRAYLQLLSQSNKPPQ